MVKWLQAHVDQIRRKMGQMSNAEERDQTGGTMRVVQGQEVHQGGCEMGPSTLGICAERTEVGQFRRTAVRCGEFLKWGPNNQVEALIP